MTDRIEEIRARHRRISGNGAAGLGRASTPRELDLINYHRATLEDMTTLLAEVDRLRAAGERLADRFRINRGLRNSEDRANAVGDATALAAWDNEK